MERTKQDLALGLVFFVSLGLLMWATVQLTGLSFAGKREERTVLFPNAIGLDDGANVFVLGKRLGSVTAIEINPTSTNPEDAVRVRIVFDTPIRVTDSYSVQIEQGSLLGGVQIQILPGDGPNELPPDVPLQGRIRVAGLDAVGDLFADGEISDNLRGILRGIRSAVDRLNGGDNTIGKLLTESTLYDELLTAVRSGRRSLEGIESGNGVLNRLIFDRSVGDDLAATVANARSISAKLDGTESPLARLIGDAEMGTEIRQVFSDVAAVTADLRAGKGAAGAFLSSAEVENDVRRITSGFAKLADQVTDPSAGLVGELVSGTATRDRFVAFVADLQDMSAEVRAARGLFGRLIYDEELGEQFTRMLTQVSRAIEDAREAAPVGTFFQVISGAF